jgi:hypothetical protein
LRKFLLLPLALLLVLVPGLGRPAAAYESWCFDDPIISIGGRLVDVQVQMPIQNLLTMRSTTLTIIIPSNVSGYVVVPNLSAFPMTIKISRTGPAWNGRGGLPVTMLTNVTASSDYPVRLTATPVVSLDSVGGLLNLNNTLLAGTTIATGKANSTVKLSMTLGR